MTHDVFKRFIQLIEFDQLLLALEVELVNIEKNIEENKKKLFVVMQDYEKECYAVHELRKQVDEQELMMRTYDTQERTARIRLDAAASPKEFQALKKEHDLYKHKQHENEQILMIVWNAYETKHKQFQSIDQAFTIKKEELQKLCMLQEEHMQLLKQRIAQHHENRKVYIQDIPEEWVAKYDRMRSTVKNPVVGIVAGTCGGCSYLLSNQLILALGQNKLMQCTSCYRLLYKHFESAQIAI